MKILADECCDANLVNALRTEGHDVHFIIELERGITDDEVLFLAYADQRLLITEDKDFGEVVLRLQLRTHGVVLLRFDPSEAELQITRVVQVFEEFGDRLLGHFTVVDSKKTRTRPL